MKELSKTDLSKLEALDEMGHLQPRVRKTGDNAGERRSGITSREDSVAEKLNECGRPSEMAILLARLGKPADDIVAQAESSPNFGRFRMWVGNVMRGILRRCKQYEDATGQQADPADFVDPKSGKPAKSTKSAKTSKSTKKSKTSKKTSKKSGRKPSTRR